jgi:hypothetical protein
MTLEQIFDFIHKFFHPAGEVAAIALLESIQTRV